MMWYLFKYRGNFTFTLQFYMFHIGVKQGLSSRETKFNFLCSRERESSRRLAKLRYSNGELEKCA
jgi:hypothetical protein